MSTRLFIRRLVSTFAFFVAAVGQIHAQGTAFTYQGRLNSSGSPANGAYDIQFILYSVSSGGSPISPILTNSATPVSNGLFTVTLDFGEGQFNGASNWLDIAVRTNGAGSFSELSPRQQLTPVPYAIFADTSSNLSGTLPANQISGVLQNSSLPANPNFSGTVTAASGFSGNGGGLTNVPLFGLASGGSLGLVTNGLNFVYAGALPAGTTPAIVVAATNLNGTGHADVVVANFTDGTITAFTNNGSGGFGTYATTAVGATPISIAVADVYNSGRSAIIAANYNSNTVTVLTNNGSGFGSNTTVSVGRGPVSVTAANLNIDGKMDLICANAGTNTLTILTNSGNGFGSNTSLTVGKTPYWVIAADVTGNGKQDLISANSGTNNLTVLINNGNGTFLPPFTYKVGNSPRVVVAADVNGDGSLDLICANNGNDITVLTNNGNGTFTPASTNSGVGNVAGAMAVVDVNGDGEPDLILANPNSVEVLLNAGGGAFTFWQTVTPTLGLSPNYYSVVAADFNGDGKPDLIAGLQGGANSLLEFLNENGSLDTQLTLPGQIGGLRVTPGVVVPDVVGGSSANVVDAGVDGAVIAGGGSVVSSNHISANDSSISGGVGNSIQQNGDHSSIGGGLQNIVSANFSFIGSGYLNSISGSYSFIGGGYANSNSATIAAIAGGQDNQVSGYASVIGGGDGNYASGVGAFIGGGGIDSTLFESLPNVANGDASVIGGGELNNATGQNSFIGGGEQNTNNGNFAALGGGQANTINEPYGTVGGGYVNSVNGYAATVSGGNANTASGYGAFVGGGGNDGSTVSGNQATGNVTVVDGGIGNNATSDYSSIGGGQNNLAAGRASVIGGGVGNANYGQQSTIAGGEANLITNASFGEATIGGGLGNTNTAPYSTIAGGSDNLVTAYGGAIGGGVDNWATNLDASVPGGTLNVAGGQYSFAAGQQAHAVHNGAFVWADSQNSTFSSTATNQFLVRAQGGVGINMNNPNGASLYVQGNRIPSAGNTGWNGSVAWFENTSTATNAAPALRVVCDGGTNQDGALSVSSNGKGLIAEFGNSVAFVVTITNDGTIYSKGVALTSDRNAKENFTPVDAQNVLAKIAAMPMTQWNYKDDDADKKHIGPIAQDFHAAFGLDGADDKHISLVDEGGVALTAIQGLNQKLEETRQIVRAKDSEIEDLKRQNAQLALRFSALEQMVQNLSGRKHGEMTDDPVTPPAGPH